MFCNRLYWPILFSPNSGNPPNVYTTNTVESMHNVIKEEQQNQSLDLVSFLENVKEKIFDRQEKELIKAVRGIGQYRLAEQFKKHEISDTRWMEMTEEQRRAVVTKIFSVSPTFDSSSDLASAVSKKGGKQLIINIDEIKGCLNFPIHTLKRFWIKAKYILDNGSIVPLPSGNYCITDEQFGYNVCENKKTKTWCCNCKDATLTGGLCPHLLVFHNEVGSLADYLERYSKNKGVAALIIDGNAPSRGGEKPCQKKKRRGANNVRSAPITSVVAPFKIIMGPNGMTQIYDINWDVPKQCTHTEYWHNDDLFFIESTKSKNGRKAKSCISCQRCFPKRNPSVGEGDIVVSHQERYSYPVKDDTGNIVKWDVSNYKKHSKFYCATKKCLLKRHQYAWKGLLIVAEDSKQFFNDEHYSYIFNELHHCD